jgi:CPA1 family monovalent cation:H+ antiporter
VLEIVEVLLVLLSFGFLSTRLAAWLRCPHSVFLVLMGIVGGILLARQGKDLPIDLHSDFGPLVFYVLLPPLIFESAYHLDVGHLRRDLVAVVSLATVGLLGSCVLIGSGLHLTFGTPLVGALLFGALISATDPVAVVALFREIGAPRRLATLVEGESLLNDGTAIVLFRLLVALPMSATLGGATIVGVVEDFFVVVVSGLAVGLVFSLLATWALRFTEASAAAQIGLTVASAYASFLVADEIHSSGVMSTLIVGLYLGNRARLELNRDALHSMQALWEFIALSANTLVFLAVGLTVRTSHLTEAAALIPATLLIVYLARAATVALVLLPLNGLGWIPRIGGAFQAVLIWGGLRGGLALALVLAIPNDNPLKEQALAMATAVVVVSLVINAISTGWLMRLLRLDQLSQSEQILYRLSLGGVVERVLAGLREVASHGSLKRDLVDELGRRSVEALTISAVETPSGSAEALDVRHALLHERQHYDDQLERGSLSARAYERLTGTVRARIERLGEQGVEALRDYAFDISPVESWWQRRLGRSSRVQALETTLETLLHLETALRLLSAGESFRAGTRDIAAAWLAKCEGMITAFHQDHPQLEVAVQAEFIAHSVAASARHALEELHQGDAISAAVYARALKQVGLVHESLVADARRRFSADVDELLRLHAPFVSMPRDALRLVEEEGERTFFSPGARVVVAPRAWHLLVRGEVEVRLDGTSTRRVGVGSTLPGHAECVVLRECEVLSVGPLLLARIVETWPEVREEVRSALPFIEPAT